MSHDLLAELAGYRNELASAERRNQTERAQAVQDEVDRVTDEIETRRKQLLIDAEGHDADGQHLLGAQARMEASRLGRAIAADQPAGDQPPAGENASQRAPRERAVTKKAGS
jgi:hypothetical protein